MSQVKSTMLVTVWVFTGIEGAVFQVVLNRKDGTATVIGLVSVLVIYFNDCIGTRRHSTKSNSIL